VNCLKRRRTHTFSPTNVSWDSRPHRVRPGQGGSVKSRHIENRAPTGLSNRISPAPRARRRRPRHHRRARARAARDAAREEDASKPKLPTSVEESLSALEGDDKIVELLGEEFVRAYTVMRRYELARLADHVTDWELQEYLELY